MISVCSCKEDFPNRTGKRFKVIINSGGGVFGYIISNFMSYLDFDIYSKIDVAGGTSIGGILSLAYSLNYDYTFINKLFKIASQKIFDDSKSLLFNNAKYDVKNLKKFLNEIYGEKKLSDIKKNYVVITTTDFTLKTPRIFENINLKKEQDLSLVDLGLFTSAAPTFFKANKYGWKTLDYDIDEIPMNEKILLMLAFQNENINKEKLKKEYSILFDGGVLENIPIISTYTTLHNEFGAEPKDIDMFVFGTGMPKNEKKFTLSDVNHWSVLEILKNLVLPYITDSNEQTAVFWGMQMGFNYFKYYNPIYIEGGMDNLSILPSIEKQCLKHKNEFLDEINIFLNK